jgi:uncharacterized membrane protein
MNSRFKNFLDGFSEKACTLLWTIIIGLILTGGVRKPIELSQVDVFGIALLAISFYRFRRGLEILPQFVRRALDILFKVYSRNSLKAVTVLFLIMTLLYVSIQQARFLSFKTNAYDMSFVERAIWSVAHGENEKFLSSSMCRGGTYLGEHFSPILALISPLYFLYDHPIWSFLAQALLILSGLFFIRTIGEQLGLPKKITAMFVLAYILYQPVRSALIFNLKEDAFFIPSLFILIVGDLKSKPVLVYLGALIALLTKENAPIALSLWALLTIPFGKLRVHKIIVLIASVSFFLFHSLFLSAYFAGGEKSAMIATRLGYLGSTPAEVLTTLFFRPMFVASQLTRGFIDIHTAKYLWLVLGSFVYLFKFANIKSPGNAYLASGYLLIFLNILFTPQRVGFHYELIAIPFLFVGGLLNAQQIKKQSSIPFFILILMATYGRSPLLELRESWPKTTDVCLSKVLMSTDKSLSVATHTDLLPHLHRRSRYKIVNGDKVIDDDLIIISKNRSMSYYAGYKANQIEQLFGSNTNYKLLTFLNDNYIWCKDLDDCDEIKKNISSVCTGNLSQR